MSDSEPLSTPPQQAEQVTDCTPEKRVFLFNQYYFDLLKKVKNQAKKQKTTNRDARNILRSIKASYASYETGAEEYLQAFSTSIPASFWDAYYACAEDKVDTFLSADEASSAWTYKQISVSMMASCVKDTFVLHNYLTIFAILSQKDTSDEDIKKAMELLKNLKSGDIAAEIESISSIDVKRWIVKLHAIYTHNITHVFKDQLSDIESTSIGRLAKEIMDEVDVSTIQNTISNEGDIFKALSDPNSGIASLLGTVSQKMIGKLASGEIKQENLLEDAMKFATKLPGMLQGSAASGSALGGDIGKMASTVQSMLGGLASGGAGGAGGSGDALGGLDFGSIASMMQGMMGGTARRPPPDSARRSAMVQRMRNKMEKAKAKENVTEK